MTLFSHNIHLIVIHNDFKTIIIEPHEIHLAKLQPLTLTLCVSLARESKYRWLDGIRVERIRTGPLFSIIAYDSVA